MIQLRFIEILIVSFLAHFELVDEFKSARFTCQNSVSMANLNHINSQAPLSTISQFGNKFPASCSMHDLNFQQRRPITGRSIQKSSTSQVGFSNVSSSYSSQSLLIPASSQINIQNQLQQLYQLQLLEQRRQMLETQFKAESGELKEYRLFRQNSTNLFDLENEAPGPVGSHLVKSNTISNFMWLFLNILKLYFKISQRLFFVFCVLFILSIEFNDLFYERCVVCMYVYVCFFMFNLLICALFFCYFFNLNNIQLEYFSS